MALLDFLKPKRKAQTKTRPRFERAQKMQNTLDPGGVVSVRRWDGALTDRLNQSHWAYAHGNSINLDLASDRETLCARCAYEMANNPMVEGCINTYVDDVIGRDGPRLQVQSDDPLFNERVERAWMDVFKRPDPACRRHGVELLNTCVRLLWTCGEFLVHAIDTRRPGPVKVGFKTYHPRRLANPYGRDPGRIAFGIEFDEAGYPRTYFIRKHEDTGYFTYVDSPTNYVAVSADAIYHVFKRLEPEQIRGVPWLASALPVIADLRDYDKHVMEASKHAAANAVFWHTDHEELDPWDPPASETHAIEPGTTTIGPPGWKPAMLQATQPTAQYVEFRHERLREIGRVANMPLMTVLLSSAESNFASAHYDGQVYSRSIDCVHGLIEREALNHLVESVITELVLSNVVSKPDSYRIVWKWKKPPFADPKKMYEALRMQLEDGAAGYDDILEPFDRTFDEVVERLAYERDKLEEAGLPPRPVNYGSGSAGAASIAVGETETEGATENVIED